MIPQDPKDKKGVALIIAGPKPGGDEALQSPEDDAADEPMGGAKSADAKCETCYAFRPSDGRCQRFPPHGLEWSYVEPTDYCCEYKAGPQHDTGSADETSQRQQSAPPAAPDYAGAMTR